MTPFKNLFGGFFQRGRVRSPLPVDAAAIAPPRGFARSRSTSSLLAGLPASTARSRYADAARGVRGVPAPANPRFFVFGNRKFRQPIKSFPPGHPVADQTLDGSQHDLALLLDRHQRSPNDLGSAAETIFFEGNFCTLAEIELHMDLEDACRASAAADAKQPATVPRPATKAVQSEKPPAPPPVSAKQFPASFPLSNPITQKAPIPVSAMPLPAAPSDLFRYVAPTGNVVTNYCSANVDMARLDSAFRNSHVALQVSGARNNCWMRTAWLSALMQGNPADIEKRLTDRLGPGNRMDIQTIVQAATDLKKKGLRSVFGAAGSFTAKTEEAMANISFALLQRNLEVEIHNTLVESGERVAKGLTSLAIPSEAAVAAKVQAMWDSTIGTKDGEAEQSAVIMRDLGLDLIILSNHGDAGRQGRSIEVSASQGSQLNRIPMHALSGLHGIAQRTALNANTTALHGAMTTLPVLIQNGGYGGGHFTLFAPKRSA